MNAPKMSTASRSFLRFRAYAEPLGDVVGMWNESKKNILDFMHRFDINQRAVFFAENIQTLTTDEVKKLLKNLANKLGDEHGVIEFHPTGDGTSKSGHIHFWGMYNENIEVIITDFIKEFRLSNKPYLNYTNAKMQTGKSYKICKFKNKWIENEFVPSLDAKEVKRKKLDEVEVAFANKVKQIKSDLNIYVEILEEYDTIFQSFFRDIKKIDVVEIEKQPIDYDLINYQLRLEFEGDFYIA